MRQRPVALVGVLAAVVASLSACSVSPYLPGVTPSTAGKGVTAVRVWMANPSVPTGLDALTDVAVRRAPYVDGDHGRYWTAMPSNVAAGVTWPATRDGDTLVVDLEGVPDGQYAVWLEWRGGHSDGFDILTVDHTPPRSTWDVPTPMADGSYLFRGSISGEEPGTVTLATSGMEGIDGNCRLPTSGAVSYRMWVTDRPQTITLTDANGNAATTTFDVPPRGISRSSAAQ